MARSPLLSESCLNTYEATVFLNSIADLFEKPIDWQRMNIQISVCYVLS